MAENPTEDARAAQDQEARYTANGVPPDGAWREEVLRETVWEALPVDFVNKLITQLADDPYATQYLFVPEYKRRCAQIKQEYEPLYQGKLFKAVRMALGERRAELWDASLAGVGQAYDPFVFTDATTIMGKPVVPRRWLIPGLIANGLTLLGGSPKSGKSYLSYALALAVAHYGTWCQRWTVERGKVIYVALEDDEEDTHLRLRELDADLQLKPGQLLFLHGEQAMPAFNMGALEWIEQTLDAHQPRLLIIDPISYLYVLKKSGNQFEETKDMLFPLRWLGKKHDCAIVCPDHRRKRSREDVSAFETLYGSVAKQAVADGLIMVDRDDDEINMEAKIRSGKDQRVYLSFQFEAGQCFLTYKGGGEDKPASYSELRMAVLTTLRDARMPMSITEIMAAIGLSDGKQVRNNIYQILFRCQKSREVEKTTRGLYVWGEHGEDAVSRS